MKKSYTNIIIVAIIVGVVCFYGGIKYAEATTGGKNQRGMPNINNMGGKNGQKNFGGRGGTGGGFINGEIISKDDKSITVKLRDGGSKIIFFTSSTEIGKFVDGEINDLEKGKSVMINGKQNQDGSVTAESIQIRPEMPAQKNSEPPKNENDINNLTK